MCARFKSSSLMRALALCAVSSFLFLPLSLQAGEKQEKMKMDMEKPKNEMEKAAEEIQDIDPAAGPVDEVDPETYDQNDVMQAPETKAIYKKSDQEKIKTDQTDPE